MPSELITETSMKNEDPLETLHSVHSLVRSKLKENLH